MPDFVFDSHETILSQVVQKERRSPRENLVNSGFQESKMNYFQINKHCFVKKIFSTTDLENLALNYEFLCKIPEWCRLQII